ncbi:2-oxo-4-hydroxy-4-carboxy-5-ureidoimidazoline decarboxylase [Lipingzhangella sp. LS1_29]|uniref:2-oxo-4-hydroxy-4-carboxy-5-ureidoimidazoline decarboxylase n=1 Tax=Lipingzhangella rawalii TaxID=2055835 RepID=A0ABU2H8M4_9ACTN|nr:2-oxo-4-hydroxy-4-carboxy-5-ureidoimidazoline decarboxylase [Lipingzhangella rawalii]MDS1271200.1 2-oxo-4-hydroxy-4-carboxy-5-ureidoimidazoline decarboxylase [Lipingzhangella rawalii]
MPDHPPPTSGTDAGLAWVNECAQAEFHSEFSACLDIDRWVAALEAERPFADLTGLLAAADRHARTITRDEVSSALARHPRIGERATGASTEASWSRGEQSGMATATEDTQKALRAGQEEYERRFGHIYLVCASGRSSADMLEDLRSRLDNDASTELGVVADELRKIALLRIEKLINGRGA